MKMSTTDDKLFFGLPEEMRQMMAHIRGLEYEDRPDYSLLHSLMMVRTFTGYILCENVPDEESCSRVLRMQAGLIYCSWTGSSRKFLKRYQ
jgi:hypothetical protein